jgi:hypothetical protein
MVYGRRNAKKTAGPHDVRPGHEKIAVTLTASTRC